MTLTMSTFCSTRARFRRLVNPTNNESSTAAAVDTASAEGNPGAPFLELYNLSSQSLNAALDAMSGEIHASLTTGAMDDSRFLRQAVLWRGCALSLLGAGPDAPLSMDAPLSAEADDGPSHIALWGQGFGSWAGYGASAQAAGMSRSIGGIVAGADAGFGGVWRLGFAGGYSSADDDVAARASSALTDSTELAVYASTALGGWNFRFGAANAWNRLPTRHRLRSASRKRQSRITAATPRKPSAKSATPSWRTTSRSKPSRAAVMSASRPAPLPNRAWPPAPDGAADNENVEYTQIGSLRHRHAGRRHHDHAARLLRLAICGRRNHAGRNDGVQRHVHALHCFGRPLAQESILIDAGVSMNAWDGMTVGLYYSGQLAGHVSDNGIKGSFTWNF